MNCPDCGETRLVTCHSVANGLCACGSCSRLRYPDGRFVWRQQRTAWWICDLISAQQIWRDFPQGKTYGCYMRQAMALSRNLRGVKQPMP